MNRSTPSRPTRTRRRALAVPFVITVVAASTACGGAAARDVGTSNPAGPDSQQPALVDTISNPAEPETTISNPAEPETFIANPATPADG